MDAQQPPKGEGNVPPEEPAQHYPPPSDYGPQYGRPRKDVTKIFTTDNIARMLALGIFLMFLGATFIALVSTGGPNTFDSKYDDDDNGSVDSNKWDEYYDDLRLYTFLYDLGTVSGRILMYLGVAALTIALFGGGIVNNELDKYVRFAMILVAGIVITWSALT